MSPSQQQDGLRHSQLNRQQRVSGAGDLSAEQFLRADLARFLHSGADPAMSILQEATRGLQEHATDDLQREVLRLRQLQISLRAALQGAAAQAAAEQSRADGLAAELEAERALNRHYVQEASDRPSKGSKPHSAHRSSFAEPSDSAPDLTPLDRLQGSLAGLAWPESQRHTASWQLPGGSRGIKRARSASTAGGPTLSPQQQDWQPWASAPTAASNRPPNRPQTSTQSGKGPAAQQHHSGGPGNDMMAPSSYPSPHGAPELDISRPAEPDLSHVPKRRRQAVGRPHAWMIAAHKSALGSGSTSNSPETSTPMAIASTHDGSGQASLDSSPSIGRPSWPWDPEPKSSQAPESAQLRMHLSVGRPASRLGPGRTGPKESDADGHKAGTSSFEGQAHAKGTNIPKASDINGHTESIDAARATPEERPDVDKGPVDQLLRTEAASTQKPLSPLLAMDTSSRCSSQGHSRAHSEG
ncbi:hypothetical protein WJX84_007804 [Apatococcus fuscideae]|uniref:Uncharacterized protein n=1 Tax=Apatococcus fuscideae TaxID=2026836 RepID=A0AAW1T5R3_9CHLO